MCTLFVAFSYSFISKLCIYFTPFLTQAGNYGKEEQYVSYLISVDSPTIDIRPISQAVNKSNNLELFCNATGHPTPQITWYKLADPSELLTVGTVLNVMNMNRTDSGVYQCRASNGIGIDAFASANVTVNSELKLIQDLKKCDRDVNVFPIRSLAKI